MLKIPLKTKNEKMKILIVIIVICLTSCYHPKEKGITETGKDLNLKYELLTKKNLFPNERTEFNYGIMIIEYPKGETYADIAETIRRIGIKENLVSAKIFTSKIGYLMEIDSISKHYYEYEKSFLAFYDLTAKGPNWKYSFKIKDIHIKADISKKAIME
jgi:hypothetical protein